MADYEQLSYDNSSPLSYREWQDQELGKDMNTGNFWRDFWNGLKGTPEVIAGVFGGGKYGRKSYQNYTDDFYNQQSIRNTATSEQNQRNFEKYMSDTAYQRGFNDIKGTGLNPSILLNSAFGPASTPSSASAFSRSSSNSSSRSESQNRSYNASALLAALIYLVAHII